MVFIFRPIHGGVVGMSNTPSKPDRFANYTLHKKLLIAFWVVSIIPLLIQTLISTSVARNYVLELANLALTAETSSSSSSRIVTDLVSRQSFAIWHFSFLIIVITIGIFTLIANRLSRPYTTLLAKAQQIAEGAFGVEIPPMRNYEVDRLALAFNKLAQELHHQVETSEQRIADRTRALETVVRSLKSTTAITQQITMILDLDELLQYIVDNIQKTFGIDYVHIYLTEDGDQTLVMVYGSGETGRQLKAKGHQIKLGEGVVGKVAETNQYFLSNNVEQTPGFVRNPLLPDTQAELAVPLRKGEQVLGVLDIQTQQTDRFQPQDLALIQSLANQTAVAVDNAHLFEQIRQANTEIQMLNERLKKENLRMSAELDVTRQLQRMLLPRAEELEQIKEVDIAGFMQPANEVGGDYYDVLKHNGTLKIGLGDVTGHGLESGVVMLMLQTAVRTLLTSEEKDPVRFLDILNRTLHDNIQRMNVPKSLTLVLLDYQKGKLRLSGQHEQVIVIRRDGQLELKDTFELGFPLALERDITPLINEMVIELQPGDGIVLYSDGITEAESETREFYGLERLCSVASKHWAEPAESIKEYIIADVQQFIGQHVVYDDLTLIVAKQR
jgi:serine phosphatase RsbU (regulator of sigma subunit)/HAMP domain-containing protein